MSHILFSLAKPVLHAMDPETAHTLTLKALQCAPIPSCIAQKPKDLLVQTIWNKQFLNPVGLAAGFDKNAEVVAPMLRLGFGFVEVGTVTPKPQIGNPRPRVFRSPENQAVINRMGFPNKGLDVFRHNIERFLESPHRPDGIVGINIGMNKGVDDPAADYCTLVKALGPYADYLTVNISSPNTPGLRNLQARENLLPLLARILEQREQSCAPTHRPPVLVKLAPDLNEAQIADVSACLLESGVDGIILTNTTLERPETLPESFRKETGGLSGAPLTQKSTTILRTIYRATGGAIPIIGVGGVSNAQDAYDKIKAGASLIQVYSALIFHGPSLVGDIVNGLDALLRKDGYTHISQAVGKGA